MTNRPPKPRLRDRFLRASAWNIGGQILTQALRLGSNIIIARLLSPDAFGVMAIVYVLIIGIGLFSDLGINKSLVQGNNSHNIIYINTAWSIQFIRGVGIAVITLAIAASLQIIILLDTGTTGNSVYSDHRLPAILSAFALVAILQGAEPTRVILEKRAMSFNKLTIIDVASQIISITVMLFIAWHTRSVAALVAGAIISTGTKCALAYIILPGHREKFSIDKNAARELLGFAKWLMLASALGFLAMNGDRVLLGGILDSDSMGQYSIAFLLMNSIHTFSSMLCSNVIFFAISEVQREAPIRLRSTVEKFQWIFDVILVPISAFLVIAGPKVIELLYDSRYMAAGNILQILAAGTIGMRHQITEQCYMALSQPKYITATAFTRLFALTIGILIGHAVDGFNGAIIGIALSQYATWPIAIFFRVKYKIYSLKSEALLIPMTILGLGIGGATLAVIN